MSSSFQLRSGKFVHRTGTYNRRVSLSSIQPPRLSQEVAIIRITRESHDGLWSYNFGGKYIDLAIDPSKASSAVEYLERSNKVQLQLTNPASELGVIVSEDRVKQLALNLYTSHSSLWNRDTMIRFLPKVGEKFAEGFRMGGPTMDCIIDDIWRMQANVSESVEGKIPLRPVPRSTFIQWSTDLIAYLRQQVANGIANGTPITEQELKYVSHEYTIGLFVNNDRNNEWPEFYEYIPKP